MLIESNCQQLITSEQQKLVNFAKPKKNVCKHFLDFRLGQSITYNKKKKLQTYETQIVAQNDPFIFLQLGSGNSIAKKFLHWMLKKLNEFIRLFWVTFIEFRCRIFLYFFESFFPRCLNDNCF